MTMLVLPCRRTDFSPRALPSNTLRRQRDLNGLAIASEFTAGADGKLRPTILGA